MDSKLLIEIISTLGFPISCVCFMGAFIFYIYKTWTKQNNDTMNKLQENCKAREEKLYNEITKNREVNAKAIEIIGLYAERLTHIESNLDNIKDDVLVIKEKIK